MEKSDEALESAPDKLLTVEVAYALPDRQLIKTLQVASGCSALEAVRQSGIALDFPGIDIDVADMGIFSKALDGKTLPLPQHYMLRSGDRIEIYRPLLADPKVARLQRAAKARENNS